MSIQTSRPVKCVFCKKAMYYVGDPRHEPEIKIWLSSSEKMDYEYSTYYAHKSCLESQNWNK
jgi:hypothetical protein